MNFSAAELAAVALVLVVASLPLVRARPLSVKARSGVIAILLAIALTVGVSWGGQVVRSELRRTAILATVPRSGNDGYVSSSACRACHPSEHSSWHRSFHRTMTQVASPETVVADFGGQTLEWAGRSYTVERRGDEFWVNMVDPTWEWDQMGGKRIAPQPGVSPPRVWRRIVMTTGSHHQQVYWTPGIKPRQLDFLPFLWLIEESRWIPRREAFLKHPTIDETLVLWNYSCIECHSTAGVPGGSAATNWRTWQTKTAELGIACEACHGPGQAHVDAHSSPLHRYTSHLSNVRDPTIFNPGRASAREASQACGQCHGIGFVPNLHTVWERGLSYRPGQDLDDSKPTIFPGRASCQGNLDTIQATDEQFAASSYWSDGMVRVSGREYNGMAESACHQRGELSCMSCHSMHDSDPNDQLSSGMATNQACAQCHGDIQRNLESHTHHAPNSTGSLCYNCHMPHTTYGLLKAIRSHQIDSPTVRAEVTTGRPNACNLCHLDQTLQWTQKHLGTWYGAKPVTLDPDQRRVAAGVRWAIRGDAGQRALAAWALGWAPAQAATAAGWQAPVLADLMVDDYSAVRFIAERSLRSHDGFANTRYDFLGESSQRQEGRASVLRAWQASTVRPGDGERFLLRADGSLNTIARQSLRARRRAKKMDLRE